MRGGLSDLVGFHLPQSPSELSHQVLPVKPWGEMYNSGGLGILPILLVYLYIF